MTGDRRLTELTGTERATCTRCGRKIAAYVPSRGDGSLTLLRLHNDPTGRPCDGSRRQPLEERPRR